MDSYYRIAGRSLQKDHSFVVGNIHHFAETEKRRVLKRQRSSQKLFIYAALAKDVISVANRAKDAVGDNNLRHVEMHSGYRHRPYEHVLCAPVVDGRDSRWAR